MDEEDSMTRSMYNRNEWNYIGHSIDYVEGNEDTYSKPKACFDERLQILSLSPLSYQVCLSGSSLEHQI